MEFPLDRVPGILRSRVVARIPMYFKYQGRGTPEAGYSTLGAIARGARTSTLRKQGTVPRAVMPGRVVEFYDEERNRSVLAVVTGRERLDLSEPGIHERLSRREQWTPAFLKGYLKPGATWEQITYQPLVTRAEGRVSPDYQFTEELIDNVINKAYTRGMTPGKSSSPQGVTAAAGGSASAVPVMGESSSSEGQRPRVQLTTTGPYTAKDQRKADQATKFIGRGSPASSTTRYAGDFGGLANTGTYTPDDVVFISAEGNRRGRIGPDFDEINRALSAGATILTDDPANRNRNYNTGERQVAQHLAANGYLEVAPGRWAPGEGMTAAGGSQAGSPAAPTMGESTSSVRMDRSSQARVASLGLNPQQWESLTRNDVIAVAGPVAAALQAIHDSPERSLIRLSHGNRVRPSEITHIEKRPDGAINVYSTRIPPSEAGQLFQSTIPLEDSDPAVKAERVQQQRARNEAAQRARENRAQQSTAPNPLTPSSTSNPPPAATDSAVPPVVKESIINQNPELEAAAENVFQSEPEAKKKSTGKRVSRPAAPASAGPVDVETALKSTRSDQVRQVLQSQRERIQELEDAVAAAPTQESFNQRAAALEELRGQHEALQDTMKTMVTKEEYDKAVAQQVAQTVIPDEQKLQANWRLAKQYGLPALAGVLGVAAGAMAFGGGDEVVVVDSGGSRGR